MKVEIKVPTLGESVNEASIASLIKPSGSTVSQDAEILELETEKVNQVLYAPASGRIEYSVKVGDTVKIGQVIGTIDTDVVVQKEEPVERPKPFQSSSRKMVADFIADLGSKPAEKMVATASNRKKMSSLRKTIAQRLVDVKNKTAMLTTFNEVDMQQVIDIRTKEQEGFTKKYGVKLGFMSFFIKAAALALKEFPDVNAMIEGDEIVYFPNCDIGVAVSTDKGLMVPVIRRCEELSYGEIEQKLADFAKRAREGKISMDDMRGGTFTITNGGVFGSLLSTPIINPPQSAILGMHAIVKRPIALNDQVVIRPMMYIALSYDHRIIDGKEAVQFLVHMKKTLEEPVNV
jgi:2-oxoglutarate dehydrogenase E2 component (dihydrolipoamide succinyltransferase)